MRKYLLSTVIIAGLFFFLFIAAIGVSESEDHGYFAIEGPCNLQFPQDHGAHPGYKTEWWYYTGNVKSEEGERYGFQLTFFRSQLRPSGEKNIFSSASAWRVNQIFLAHAALSDLEGKRYFHADQSARAALGMAGANQKPGITTIFLKKWSAQMKSSEHILKAFTDDFSFELNLKPAKKTVLHGERGYSLKGMKPESASCYYSVPRLDTRGIIIVGEKSYVVQGTSWMDHEFSSAPLEEDLEGWDWLSLQFENFTELMVYFLRKKNGTISSASSGTFVDKAGRAIHLSNDDLTVKVLKSWKSPQTGARYPVQWELKIHPLSMDLMIVSNLKNQEMLSQGSTGVTYWEGSVSVDGVHHEQLIKGMGYVELTGYEKAFDAPL